MTPPPSSSFRLLLVLVCEKRARLPRATRASKYWLLFESVIWCLRTHGFSPPTLFISLLPSLSLSLCKSVPYPRDCRRRYFNPRASIPHAGYLHRSCLLLVFLAPREIRRFRLGPDRLSRDAIYCTPASLDRALVNLALSRIRFRLRDICKKYNICNISREREKEGGKYKWLLKRHTLSFRGEKRAS